MPLLEVQNLSMRFGGITAVNGVSFAVEPGQIFSVIGPNGAGKTTVFNAVTGIYNPSDGRILFEGKSAERPFDWRVVAGCLATGFLMALFAFLAAVGVEGLWYAAIKRPVQNGDPVTARGAIRDGLGYVRGELAVEKTRRSSRWEVTSSDGKTILAVAPQREQADEWRTGLQQAVDGATVSAPGPDPDPDKLAKVGADAGWHRTVTLAASGAGFVLGLAGAYVVWHRGRRSPDGIALGGIARTFQNIRLFGNMTVRENVLVGLDRTLSDNPLAMALRLPSVRRHEHTAEDKAHELLDFVGLGTAWGALAKNLPYGDQRRLEIARALATEPRLLLLDEPAAGMNPSETAALMTLIRKVRDRGVTVLLIEHHMSLVMGISDRVAVLDYGSKIAEGPPAEVSRNPKVVEAYLGKEEVS